MVMLEEFRRRKKLKDYFDLMRKREIEKNEDSGTTNAFQDMDENALFRDKPFQGTGPERFFERDEDDIFNTKHFTLIFIDSDSVTNVTKLNRVNHRRVLLFIGNSDGVISYGKGKAVDYENAFE